MLLVVEKAISSAKVNHISFYRSYILLELGRFCLDQNLSELGVQCLGFLKSASSMSEAVSY